MQAYEFAHSNAPIAFIRERERVESLFMTINIYHRSGKEAPVLNVDGVLIPRFVSIGDEGGLAGIDTSGGRVVVQADVRDYRQITLPIKVWQPEGNEFGTFQLARGGTKIIDIVTSVSTLFGESNERIDRIVFERM